MADTNISGQGYLYGDDPKATNPFFSKYTGEGGSGSVPEKYVEDVTFTPSDDNEITASVTTVSDTGATTETVTTGPWNIKGEKGDTGATGATGATGPQGPEGPQGEKGADGTAATVTVGTVTTGDPGTEASVTNSGTENAAVLNFTIPRGDKGETGAQGEQGAAGSDANTEGLVSNVSVANENGVYTFSQTKKDSTAETGETTSEIGTIEVPEALAEANVVAEVKDTVVEDNTNEYDFHTITETQYDGTENEVGKFYIAQKQLLTSSLSPAYVDQSGNVVTGTYGHGFAPHLKTEIPEGSSSTKYFLCTIEHSYYPAFTRRVIIPYFSDKTLYDGLCIGTLPNFTGAALDTVSGTGALQLPAILHLMCAYSSTDEKAYFVLTCESIDTSNNAAFFPAYFEAKVDPNIISKSTSVTITEVTE